MRPRQSRILPPVAAGAFMIGACTLWAGDFCVDNADTLKNILLWTAVNGEDDRVLLVQGVYVGDFVYPSTEGFALEILGGHTEGCEDRAIDPANTGFVGTGETTVLVLGVENATRLTLEGIAISGGTASGLLVAGTAREVILRRNAFADNSGALGGGASVRVVYDGSITLTGNSFSGNRADYNAGGAYIYADSGIATLTGNSFDANQAEDRGGGAYVVTRDGIATLNDNSFEANQVGDGGYGAGVYVYGIDGEVVLTRNSFRANEALGTGEGGGSYINAASAVATLASNRFDRNRAGTAGAVSIDARSGTATLTNNSLVGNQAEADGGALRVFLFGEDGEARLYNNLFWDNSAAAGNDLWLDNDGDRDFEPAPLTLLHNAFDQTAETGYRTAVPILIDPSNRDAVDPLFADDDLRLSPASPLIDAGQSGAPALPAMDFEGQGRTLGGGVDIGADEYDGGTYRALQEVYIAYYGRPADPAGQEWWAEQLLQSGGDLTAIIQQFGTSAEFDAYYGGLDNEVLVDTVYHNMFGREPDAAGRNYYVGRLDAGTMTLQTATLDILNGAQNEDAVIIDNKVDCARYFTVAVLDLGLSYTDQQIPDAREMLGLAGVDSEALAACRTAADTLLATMGN